VADASLDCEALERLAREAQDVVGPEAHYCEAMAAAR
jgi:hypothetical protein